MADREGGGIDFAAAFALGALFGAGVALFLAPQSGENLRKEARKKGKGLKKDAEKHLGKAGERVREAGEEWLEEAEERLGGLTEEITEAVEEGMKTIRLTVAEELKDLEKKVGKRKGLFR
jgi:gas vesicle protein